MRRYVIPALPDTLFTIGAFQFTRRMGMFGLFAALMIPAAFSMLKKRQEANYEKDTPIKYNYPVIITEGLIVGAVTGMIGAGGGFLIIPTLVILAKMEIKVAIGTSLMIIAFKSLLGFFLGDALTIDIDWSFLMLFTALSFVGTFIGSYLSLIIDGAKLKKGFGYFIFVMAIFIFYMEFFISK